MKLFLKLNRHKLWFAFSRTSLILLSGVFTFLTLGYYNGQFPNLYLLITIIFVTGIIGPLVIIFLAYLFWLQKHLSRQKAFSRPPLDKIQELGFQESILFENSKWNFSELSKSGRINGYNLICDFSLTNNSILQIKALVKWKSIEKEELRRLSNELKPYDIEFDVGGLIKNLKKQSDYSIDDLKRDLEQFVEILRKYEFDPQL